MRALEGRAIFEGPEFPVFLRIGEQDGAVFIDLADTEWRAVRVTPQGWEVIARAPVKFLRSNAMRALPVPEAGGLIEAQLRDLVNVRDETDFKLLVGWLVGAFHPRGPYTILAINGEQGSAKSTHTRLVRLLVDPNDAEIRSAPRDEHGLVVAALNSWVVALDNLSDIQSWLSDALCRLSTGGGFSARELYSDTGEIVIKVTRPIVLNGIPDLGGRADLADRSIHLVLPAIPEADRRSDADYWREVEARRPLIFGAILDGVVGALRHRDEIPPTLTRMADFVAWVSGAETVLGWRRVTSPPPMSVTGPARSRRQSRLIRLVRRFVSSSQRTIGRARRQSC